MTDDDLRMLRLELETRALFQLARRRRLPPDTDLGYLVHCALGELFGEAAPRPFAVVATEGRRTQILAYSAAPVSELRRRADELADPGLHGAVGWDDLRDKTLPQRWTSGARYGFEVTVCPVVRTSGRTPEARRELDAFLARCRDAGPDAGLDRMAVYCDWLRDELARRGGAHLNRFRVDAFRLVPFHRREHGTSRAAVKLERPEVRFRGQLTVHDPVAFTALLRRGVGRHRSFGFGMLLLRPGERAC